MTTRHALSQVPPRHRWLTVLLVLLVALLVGCGASTSPPSGPTPTSTKQIIEFPIPTSSGSPQAIAAGPDGNLWFVELVGIKIGRITPSGTITEFALPSGDSGFSSGAPVGITAGPDGNLWFTENLGNKIGRITPSGQIREFALPSAISGPYRITAGPDGALWFTACVLDPSGSTMCASNSKIGRITSGGQMTEFALPSTESGPTGITAGPDGNLWFTEDPGNKIGRITPSGTITEFAIPTSQSSPFAITAGPDGNLWFTEDAANKIGQITPSGRISEFSVPTSASAPEGITKGPDGKLWFTEFIGNKIGQITNGK